MDELRFCTDNGWVVGGDYWLPTEPSDFSWPGSPCIGCNHLRCSRCTERVVATLRDSIRHYACSCVSHDEDRRQLLDPTYTGYPGLSALHSPAPIGWWSCAGHPALALPAVVDGVTITPERFREIARTGFASPPFTAPQTSSHAFWVTRLYWLLPEALRPQLSLAVAELMSDADPLVVRGATDYLRS